MTSTKTIAVTAQEQALLDGITFDFDELESRDFNAHGDAVVALMRSLLERQGIPAHRWQVFADPECNPGGYGRSNQQIFENNGCRGEAIFRHAQFLPYLNFFLNGSALPSRFKSEFEQTVDRMAPITSGALTPLGKLARKLARDHGLSGARARDGVFWLALDCGLSPSQATHVRTAVTR